MRFSELGINEALPSFQRRTGSVGSNVGYGHGGAVASRGGSLAAQAQRDATRKARQQSQGSGTSSDIGSAISSMFGMGGGGAAAGGTGAGGSAGGDDSAGTGGATTTDPNARNNPGRTGNVRFGSSALTTLNGQQSTMTRAGADRAMQSTIQRAQRMAGFFGGTITVNDAIPRRGSSRERETQGSQHFHGNALDISTSGMSNQDKIRLVQAAQRAGFTGFGFGSNILHVDTGPRRHWAYGNSSFGGVSVASLGTQVRANQLVSAPSTRSLTRTA
jgi:hypothetical protein